MQVGVPLIAVFMTEFWRRTSFYLHFLFTLLWMIIMWTTYRWLLFFVQPTKPLQLHYIMPIIHCALLLDGRWVVDWCYPNIPGPYKNSVGGKSIAKRLIAKCVKLCMQENYALLLVSCIKLYAGIIESFLGTTEWTTISWNCCNSWHVRNQLTMCLLWTVHNWVLNILLMSCSHSL